MNAEKALKLIVKNGIYGLCEGDGCRCCHFNVHSIFVDVYCHKSEHTVRVYSHCMFRDPMQLEPIAKEVLRQLGDCASGYRVRFCEYEADHVKGKRVEKKWVEEYKCAYCGEKRDNPQEYLCDSCATKKDEDGWGSPREYYPWTNDGFLVSGIPV